MFFRHRHVHIGVIRMLVTLAVAGTAMPAIGQTYVWKDPKTGQTHMSDKRPPWYRSSDPSVRGPRTQVLINGQVIDDTGVALKPEQAARVERQLGDATRQRAVEERDQQGRVERSAAQAQSMQRQEAIGALERRRKELMYKIAGGPLVAGSGPFDTNSVSAAATELADVNRQLNTLDPGGAEARRSEQRRALGAVARQRQEQMEKERDREAVRGAVKEGIRDCVRFPYSCQ